MNDGDWLGAVLTGCRRLIGSMVRYRKIGGLHHWRVGRIGGSVYFRR